VRRHRFASLALAGFLVAGPAVAQQGPPPCSGDESRQFDFWLGQWNVTVVGTGQAAGTSSITSILGGCVLLEEYETPSGYVGKSFNAYDRVTGQWHQSWVDNQGQVLKLDGGIEDGKMVLSGVGKDRQGNEIVNRITWTPHEDGSVQQTWDVSRDGGSTWSNVFDGLYRAR